MNENQANCKLCRKSGQEYGGVDAVLSEIVRIIQCGNQKLQQKRHGARWDWLTHPPIYGMIGIYNANDTLWAFDHDILAGMIGMPIVFFDCALAEGYDTRVLFCVDPGHPARNGHKWVTSLWETSRTT